MCIRGVFYREGAAESHSLVCDMAGGRGVRAQKKSRKKEKPPLLPPASDVGGGASCNGAMGPTRCAAPIHKCGANFCAAANASS